MSIGDDVKKVLEDLQVDKRLADASEQLDRGARNAMANLGGYVAARESEISELIDRTAGKLDERTEGRWSGTVDKVRAGLQTGVAKLAEQKPDRSGEPGETGETGETV